MFYGRAVYEDGYTEDMKSSSFSLMCAWLATHPDSVHYLWEGVTRVDPSAEVDRYIAGHSVAAARQIIDQVIAQGDLTPILDEGEITIRLFGSQWGEALEVRETGE